MRFEIDLSITEIVYSLFFHTIAEKRASFFNEYGCLISPMDDSEAIEYLNENGKDFFKKMAKLIEEYEKEE